MMETEFIMTEVFAPGAAEERGARLGALVDAYLRERLCAPAPSAP